jgi:hypothetical protein
MSVAFQKFPINEAKKLAFWSAKSNRTIIHFNEELSFNYTHKRDLIMNGE